MRRHHWQLTRDGLMFAGGAAMLAYETVAGTDRPNIIYGGLALMGVAAYLRGVSIVNGKRGP